MRSASDIKRVLMKNLPEVAMPYTLAEKIDLIEKMMCAIAKIEHVGEYNAITKTIAALRAIASSKFYFDPLVSNEMMEILKKLNLTQEEITQIEDKRSVNRDIIREMMITILERSQRKSLINIHDAKNIFLRIKQIDDTEYLTLEEINKIRDANILSIDESWVFNEFNMGGIQQILGHTNLQPREAFDFYDTLAQNEKANLLKTIIECKSFLKTQINKLVTAGLSIDESYQEIKRKIAGETSKYDALFDLASIKINKNTLNFFDITYFGKAEAEIKSNWVNDRFSSITNKFINTIAEQPVAIAKSFLEQWHGWVNCQIAKACPAVIPELGPLVQTNNSSNEFHRVLADLILNEKEIQLENLEQSVEYIVNDKKFVEYFSIDYFKNKLENYKDAESIKKICTEEFKAKLVVELRRSILENSARQLTDSFSEEIYAVSLEQRSAFVTGFETWFNCYMASKNYAMAQEICNGLWKVVGNTAISAVTEGSQIAASVDNSNPNPVIPVSKPQENDNSCLIVQSVLMVGAGLTVAGLFYNRNRLFGNKKAVSQKKSDDLQAENKSSCSIV